MAQSPLLTLTSVSHQFENGLVSLKDVNLPINEGLFHCLIGPSGCGKSTILRLISGLLTPGAGVVAWRQDVKDPVVGYVFQDPLLLPWASVEKNITLPLRIAGVLPDERRKIAAELIELTGLAEFSDTKPHELSGGMKMRVSLARALSQKPDVLLMDEPFAALDAISRDHMNMVLTGICAQQSITTVFVTHSLQEAAFLGDEIFVMSPRPGTITEQVSVTEAQPRQADFRSNALYHQICDQLAGVIRSEVL